MVNTAVTIATNLHIKPSFLEVTNQWQAAAYGIWLALSNDLLCGFIKLLEGRRVQVACYTLEGISLKG